ncbi:hypothetical protein TrST_g12934 [Triparma strigata]|uniref:Sm domain-containing protein n=1 Tax=Triparma strigata TaxID=1606541 RepID=A0A9W7ESN1_9STRA|nr:hypothetical protein TrST_g12934 [Triparma strigata]
MAEPSNISRQSLLARLTDYYKLVAPHLIEDSAAWQKRFDEIYEKFGGSIANETKLQAKLEKKYGRDVKLTVTESAFLQPPKSKRQKTSALNPRPKPKLSPQEEELLLQPSTKVLDFTRNDFDAYTALHSEEGTLNLVLSSTQVMDNIDRCRRILPSTDPFFVDRPVHKPSTTSSVVPASNPTSILPKKMKEDPPLVALAQSLSSTPLALLSQAAANRTKVSVMVRYINCIRGTVVGFVDGFDKHFNIILANAVEFYYPRSVDSNTLTQEEMERRRRSSRYKSRKFRQLIIRGDNVVSVQEYSRK